jgi:hypothetical protein
VIKRSSAYKKAFGIMIAFSLLSTIVFFSTIIGAKSQLVKNKQYQSLTNECTQSFQGKLRPSNHTIISSNDTKFNCIKIQNFFSPHENKSSSTQNLPLYKYQYPYNYHYSNSSHNTNLYQYQNRHLQQQLLNQQQIKRSPNIQNPSSSSPFQNPSSSSPFQNPSSSSPNQYTHQPRSSVNINKTNFTQQSPRLTVVTHFTSTGSNSLNPSNLSQVVANEYPNPDGYTYSYHFTKGSQTGVSFNLKPGSYAVYEPINNTNNTNTELSTNPNTTTYSGDCVPVRSTITSDAGSSSIFGYGTIKPGESKTCIVTITLLRK